MRYNNILIREYAGHDYLAPYNIFDYDLVVSIYHDSLTCFILHDKYLTLNNRGYSTIDYLLSLDISLENTLKLTKCKNKIMENINANKNSK